jgi:translation elongation factor EF-Ts
LKEIEMGKVKKFKAKAKGNMEASKLALKQAKKAIRKAEKALRKGETLERVTGIEPAWPAWKAGALPLSYIRVLES